MADSRKKKIPLRKFFPNGFDKTNPDDMMALTVLIQEKAAQNPEYDGYTVYRVDDEGMYAIIAPMDEDNISEINEGVKAVKLDIARCADPAAQKKTVQQMETEYPGYSVVDFVRLSNKEGMVLMQQLDEKTVSTRRIIANVLGLNKQPWNIRVSRTPENGWKIRIKEGAVTYQASKFDVKMQEAVETIGKPGWFFKANPETGVIMIYPGVLPTFPKTIPVPKKVWDTRDNRRSYFGMKLPEKGRETGDLLYNDWKDGPGVLVAGASNGGKSVVINSLIYGHLAGGGDLIIVDDEDKAADFRWCRPWVMDMGWGCDGIESCAAVLRHVMDLCSQRAEVIKRYNTENWWGLPDEAKKQYPPILLVCDEISQWAVAPKIPTGLDKDNPDLIRAKYENAIQSASFISLLKISQKARFAGIRFLYAAQSATAQAGLDPKVRINLSSKILLGQKVQDSIRENVLNDAKHAPTVPENVIAEGRGIGTGVAELAGQEAVVYKGFYEDDHAHGKSYSDILKEHLQDIRPAPGNEESGHLSWAQIIQILPAAANKPDDGSMYGDDDSEGDRPRSRLETEGGFGVDGRDVADHDAPLKGAAAAAHASKLVEAQMRKPQVSAIDAARSLARLQSSQNM